MKESKNILEFQQKVDELKYYADGLTYEHQQSYKQRLLLEAAYFESEINSLKENNEN